MQPARASITAENNALLRAHESMRPPGEQVCSDAYAVWFLPDRLMDAADSDQQIRQAVADWENRYPGVVNTILARTRFIDDCLMEAIGDGIGQVVILGAGYDTRSLRFDTLKDGIAVFELDHPDTQRVKLQRIAAREDADLSHVRFVPIDFSREPLKEKLFANGYDARKKAFFIWEGVTYYLHAAAVDRTLGFIRRYAARGSTLVFDYCPPAVVDGATRQPEALALRNGLKHIGEEIVFGIAPEGIVEFMTRRGFAVTDHLGGLECRDRYFSGAGRRRKVSEMFLFVRAQVA
jgi:methyltransferase (TIGR00027 family)